MKNNTTTMILNGVLAICLVLSAWFCLKYIMLTREVRSISGQVAAINAFRTTIQSLATDCVAYSEKNHAIDPILKSVGIEARPAAAKQPATR